MVADGTLGFCGWFLLNRAIDVPACQGVLAWGERLTGRYTLSLVSPLTQLAVSLCDVWEWC